MDGGRPERRKTRGFAVAASGGDLIGDIHRQQRRKVIKRAAQLAALAVVLLLLGLGFKTFADRRSREQALARAVQHYVEGTSADIGVAADVLGVSLERDGEHPDTLAAQALVLAHLWVEFGDAQAAAQAAVDAVPSEHPLLPLARALLAFGAGNTEEARTLLEAGPSGGGEGTLGRIEYAWLHAMLTVADHSDDPEALRAEAASLQTLVDELTGGAVALRRARSFLLLVAGDHEKALEELEQARSLSRSHMGLAADEALYNAYLHQELAGVASVADQLLGADAVGLSPRDRAHARLARAVVHVWSGEAGEGLDELEQAWPELAQWNRLPRVLAIQTALEAGDGSNVKTWIEQTDLPAERAAIFDAWGVLANGRVMEALTKLAELPQEDPWVGYLQALALVEQRRFAEAGPWLDRTSKLLPRRPDVEVAQARVELRLADKAVALKKLEALAEQESYAPRAFTGLGEAYLLQDKDEGDPAARLQKAKAALEKAIEREPYPAEAMLLLAQVWDRKRKSDPDAEKKALELLERAAETNPHLPRYREQLALYLADVGRPERALELMRELEDTPGVSWPVVVRRVQLELKTNERKVDYAALLEQAKTMGADEATLQREQARVILATGGDARIVEAQQMLLQRLDKDPQDVEARILYAMGHLRAGDRKAAEAAIRKGLGVTPDAKHGRLYLAWAQIDERAGKRAAAAPHARSAWIRMLAEDRPTSELLDSAELATELWLRQSSDRVAVTIAKQLTDRVAHHPRAWTIRARTELGAGEAAEARAAAERAIALDPDNAMAHLTLGHTLLRFGYKDKAKAEYDKALALAKGTPLQREIEAAIR